MTEHVRLHKPDLLPAVAARIVEAILNLQGQVLRRTIIAHTTGHQQADNRHIQGQLLLKDPLVLKAETPHQGAIVHQQGVLEAALLQAEPVVLQVGHLVVAHTTEVPQALEVAVHTALQVRVAAHRAQEAVLRVQEAAHLPGVVALQVHEAAVVHEVDKQYFQSNLIIL